MNNLLILDNFIEVLASEKGLALNTRIAYKNDILQFLRYIKKNEIKIEDIVSSDLERYLLYFKNKSLQKTSVSRKLSSLIHFFNFLIENKIISNN